MAGKFNGKLDQDKVTRASLIIGLFKGLRLLFNGPLTYGWPKSPNAGPGFNGRSPVEVMIDGGIPAMMQVRQHIDALRGGVGWMSPLSRCGSSRTPPRSA